MSGEELDAGNITFGDNRINIHWSMIQCAVPPPGTWEFVWMRVGFVNFLERILASRDIRTKTTASATVSLTWALCDAAAYGPRSPGAHRI